MREKASLYLLFISLVMIIGIDVTPYAFGESPWLSYLESGVDGAVVVLTYWLLKRELRFRTKVLDMAAHDLRNPLGIIRGYSELILEKNSSPETEREMIRRIHIKSDEILQLVDDLLDSAVVDRGQVKIERERLPLSLLVAQSVAEFDKPAASKGQNIELDLDGSTYVMTDPARMKQVLTNLLSNAVKYSPPNSTIKVKAGPHGGRARIQVRDAGPGLSRAESQLVFDSFTTVKKKTTGGESSTGIGLSISKNLVELHGGKIWVESEGEGRGSTFVVELPVTE